MEDQEDRQRVVDPVFSMAVFAVEDVIVTTPTKVGGPSFYLEGDQLPPGLSILVQFFGLSVDTVVTRGLLAKYPPQSREDGTNGMDAGAIGLVRGTRHTASPPSWKLCPHGASEICIGKSQSISGLGLMQILGGDLARRARLPCRIRSPYGKWLLLG